MSTRSMVLDTNSINAELLLSQETLAKVEVVVLDILRAAGPLVDDSITDLYLSRVENYPAVPKVTPQRIRSARAALTRRGLIVDSGKPGHSALGNHATVWALGGVKK